MALFREHSSLQVVFRKHEIIVEVLDGALELISDNTVCNVLVHKPNDKWSFDVFILSEKSADKAFEEYTALGNPPTNSDTRIFYAVVCKTDLNDYVALHKYTLIGEVVRNEVEVNIPIQPNIVPIVIQLPEETTGGAPGTSLVRNFEAPTYKFKSPNQR